MLTVEDARFLVVVAIFRLEGTGEDEETQLNRAIHQSTFNSVAPESTRDHAAYNLLTFTPSFATTEGKVTATEDGTENDKKVVINVPTSADNGGIMAPTSVNTLWKLMVRLFLRLTV